MAEAAKRMPMAAKLGLAQHGYRVGPGGAHAQAHVLAHPGGDRGRPAGGGIHTQDDGLAARVLPGCAAIMDRKVRTRLRI